MLLIAMGTEHGLGYFIAIFRSYDIENNGILDINGVPRGKVESLLGALQFFYVCLILGFEIRFFIFLPPKYWT